MDSYLFVFASSLRLCKPNTGNFLLYFSWVQVGKITWDWTLDAWQSSQTVHQWVHQPPNPSKPSFSSTYKRALKFFSIATSFVQQKKTFLSCQLKNCWRKKIATVTIFYEKKVFDLTRKFLQPVTPLSWSQNGPYVCFWWKTFFSSEKWAFLETPRD